MYWCAMVDPLLYERATVFKSRASGAADARHDGGDSGAIQSSVCQTVAAELFRAPRGRYRPRMPEITAIYHRTKEVNIYPLTEDRCLIEAFLLDEVHDVHAEVEIVYPALEIVAARSEVRSGPFTTVCNLTHPNMEKLVGMRVARGFTQAARTAVGGSAGCHRVSELVVELVQAAYQLHFVRFFGSLPRAVREGEDVPTARHAAVLQAVP